MGAQPTRPSIRRAGPADAETVVRIYVASWNAGFGERMRTRAVDDEMVGRWRRDLAAAPPHYWWVAERAGTIIGVAGIGPSRDPLDPALGELDTIAVDPAAWRTGIGRLLMSQVLRALSEGPYREAIVWTLANYPLGAAFYEATGWIANGRTRDDGRQVSYTHALPAR